VPGHPVARPRSGCALPGRVRRAERSPKP
jgi:hypothetical protein